MSTNRHPRATKQARSLRSSPTAAEQRLWYALRRRQFEGHKSRRQHPVGDYIVDFVCLEQWLVIEVDGSQHLEQGDYDAARDRWIEEQGFRVLRFWNSDVLTALDSVEAVILEALEALPLPNPPPRAGRGLPMTRPSIRQMGSAELAQQREV